MLIVTVGVCAAIYKKRDVKLHGSRLVRLFLAFFSVSENDVDKCPWKMAIAIKTHPLTRETTIKNATQ